MEMDKPFTFEGEDPFLHWLNACVIRVSGLDDYSFVQIAIVAQEEFPDIVIDSVTIREGLKEVARLKNFMEWPGSDFWT